jgi:CheY-like chemotaxis protein
MTTVLFIDDEPDTLTTMQKAVEMFGHKAILATSGKEAPRVAAEQLPNLIFVDMNLSDTDGLSIVRALRQQPATANIPVIMLSAGPEADAADRALSAGAQAYILKPIRLQTLLDTITKYGQS